MQDTVYLDELKQSQSGKITDCIVDVFRRAIERGGTTAINCKFSGFNNEALDMDVQPVILVDGSDEELGRQAIAIYQSLQTSIQKYTPAASKATLSLLDPVLCRNLGKFIRDNQQTSTYCGDYLRGTVSTATVAAMNKAYL